ncbi:hypothetical protein GCM10010145_17130 [Streptomyces ruber]|uniref:Uncharacterized protein n=2 Tax=Streptomyces TaxID=1883 RepID=A0A918BA20_9ACTN|nr:hypothetical protein GCM10010145_17130 [Streptomyces ruber]
MLGDGTRAHGPGTGGLRPGTYRTSVSDGVAQERRSVRGRPGRDARAACAVARDAGLTAGVISVSRLPGTQQCLQATDFRIRRKRTWKKPSFRGL